MSKLAGYGVTVRVDFGWRFSGAVDGSPRVIAAWDKGAWELAELQAVLQGVKDADSVFRGEGSSFASRIGPATYNRIRGTDVRLWLFELLDSVGGAFEGRPGRTAMALTLRDSVNLYDRLFQEDEKEWRSTVVHEAAHVWDLREGMSQHIGGYVGYEPRPDTRAINRREDFAYSFEAVVYDSSTNQELRNLHEQFISLAVANSPLIMSHPWQSSAGDPVSGPCD